MAAVSVVLLLTLSSPANPAIHAPSGGGDDRPEVKPVDAHGLLDVVRRSDADAVLVNVWATWCIPCREEFPDLLRLRRTYHDEGLELLLVSGDFPSEIDQVEAFLAEHGVDFETYIKTGDDMEFIDTLEPEWSGALPATLVYDRQGEKRRFWQGAATYEELERAVLPLLGSTAGGRDRGPDPSPGAPIPHLGPRPLTCSSPTHGSLDRRLSISGSLVPHLSIHGSPPTTFSPNAAPPTNPSPPGPPTRGGKPR